jgi:hypothetical protein
VSAGKERLLARIEVDFRAHETSVDAVAKMAVIREDCEATAKLLVREVPEGRELHKALSALELVMFHANAGIARHGQ